MRLRLPGGIFPSGLPSKALYVPLPSPKRATSSTHLILLDSITYNNPIKFLVTENTSFSCKKKCVLL